MISSAARTLWVLFAWIVLTTLSSAIPAGSFQHQVPLQSCEAELKAFCRASEHMHTLGTESSVCLSKHLAQLGAKCRVQLEDDIRRSEVLGHDVGQDQSGDHITAGLHISLRLAWLKVAEQLDKLGALLQPFFSLTKASIASEGISSLRGISRVLLSAVHIEEAIPSKWDEDLQDFVPIKWYDDDHGTNIDDTLMQPSHTSTRFLRH